MRSRGRVYVSSVFTLLISFCIGGPAFADSITPDDIVAVPKLVNSGNGLLDLRLFTFSGSEIQNTSGAFNGDNGNNTLPQGGGGDSASFAESYVTTAGDLKAFYNLNFPPGSITDIVLFLDLNETGPGSPTNTLTNLDIILNPATIQGSPNPAGDVSSGTQAAINQVYTGGALIANLVPEPAGNLPVQSQGAGFADYAILMGINPFSLNDSDVLLFNISMEDLSSGSEEIFLSGASVPDINPEPPPTVIPEPATLTLLSLSGIGLLLRRRRSRSG